MLYFTANLIQLIDSIFYQVGYCDYVIAVRREITEKRNTITERKNTTLALCTSNSTSNVTQFNPMCTQACPMSAQLCPISSVSDSMPDSPRCADQIAPIRDTRLVSPSLSSFRSLREKNSYASLNPSLNSVHDPVYNPIPSSTAFTSLNSMHDSFVALSPLVQDDSSGVTNLGLELECVDIKVDIKDIVDCRSLPSKGNMYQYLDQARGTTGARGTSASAELGVNVYSPLQCTSMSISCMSSISSPFDDDDVGGGGGGGGGGNAVESSVRVPSELQRSAVFSPLQGV